MVSVRTNGGTSGDPFISMDISGVQGWSLGIDNSDGDSFKISEAWNDVGVNTRMKISAGGRIQTVGKFTCRNSVILSSSDTDTYGWAMGTLTNSNLAFGYAINTSTVEGTGWTPIVNINQNGGITANSSTFIGDVGWGSTYAGLAHNSTATTTSYGYLQSSSGQTMVNSASGQNIEMRNNNDTQWSIAPRQTIMGRSIQANIDFGNGYGNGYVFKTGNGWGTQTGSGNPYTCDINVQGFLNNDIWPVNNGNTVGNICIRCWAGEITVVFGQGNTGVRSAIYKATLVNVNSNNLSVTQQYKHETGMTISYQAIESSGDGRRLRLQTNYQCGYVWWFHGAI